MGEMTHDDHPPIHYELNTLDDATPGDYKILFGLTYSNDEKVYQDKEEIEIHVNSWREEHQSMLELVGVFGGGCTSTNPVPRICTRDANPGVHISSRSVVRGRVLLWMTDTFRLFWAEMGRPVSRKSWEFGGRVYEYANQNRRRLCVPT